MNTTIERRLSAGDGLSLYVRDYGGGDNRDTVLCLGGMTRNSKDFHGLARRLCARYRVLAPDYRGRGQSAYDPDWRHYQPSTYLDDIRHITVALGIHRFAVVGTSMGGILAMALGTAMPGAVRGALLNDIGPAIPATGLEPVLAYMRNTAPLPHWEAAVAYLQTTFPNLPANTSVEWRQIAEATYRENETGQLVFDWDPAINRAFEHQDATKIDLWPYFHSLGRVPVLAVRGALSPFVADDLWQTMQTERPDMKHITVEGVGHAPSLNEPEVVTAMEHWLAACFG